MNQDEVRLARSTPLTAGAYPRGPYRFIGREYLNITYESDRDALRSVVPEPLEIVDPVVRFEIMRMPDAWGLGDYTEAGQIIRVRYQGEEADYLHAMYLDNAPAIALGREASAYPKKAGIPRLHVESDTLVGTLDYGSVRVATATIGYKHRVLEESAARAEITAPTYMLRIVPGYNGPPRISELVRTEITDLTIRGAWTSPARLQLFEHVAAPLADLPVRKVRSATHILTDLTLPSPTVVHDYLA